MAEKLPNPFEAKKGTEDYIGFSASSTPREDKFQPKRGKQNRQDNWRRFGAFEQQRQQRGGGGMLPVQGGYSPQTSNFANSTPNWSQQGQWNGSPYRGRGSGGFTPRGRGGGNFTPRGRGGNFTPRGRDGGFSPRGNFTPRGGRGGGHQDNSNRSYFHPSMLEDPWSQLMNKNNSANQSLSDSLKPQLGDSMMINPAPDVPDSLEEDSNNDLSKYSYNSDKPDANVAEMYPENNLDVEVPEEEENESFQRPNLSDSMIPLVGDSILEREDAEDDVE